MDRMLARGPEALAPNWFSGRNKPRQEGGQKSLTWVLDGCSVLYFFSGDQKGMGHALPFPRPPPWQEGTKVFNLDLNKGEAFTEVFFPIDVGRRSEGPQWAGRIGSANFCEPWEKSRSEFDDPSKARLLVNLCVFVVFPRIPKLVSGFPFWFLVEAKKGYPEKRRAHTMFKATFVGWKLCLGCHGNPKVTMGGHEEPAMLATKMSRRKRETIDSHHLSTQVSSGTTNPSHSWLY